MTIRCVGRTVITTGKSHPGEEWEETFDRLYHEALGPLEPRRRIVFSAHHGFEAWAPPRMVIMANDDAPDDERQDPPVFVTTEQPRC
jgi:hypothetical protein